MITKITKDNIREWAEENERLAKLAFEHFKEDHNDDIKL